MLAGLQMWSLCFVAPDSTLPYDWQGQTEGESLSFLPKGSNGCGLVAPVHFLVAGWHFGGDQQIHAGVWVRIVDVSAGAQGP